MSYGDTGSTPATNDGNRHAAREKAQLHRHTQKKLERRNSFIIKGGIAVTILAIIGVVVTALIVNIPRSVPGPLNMLSDGIRIGENYVAEQTAALQPGESPVPSVPSADPDIIDIVVYVDYFCEECATFEKTNDAQISTWLEGGAATYEVHPIAILDQASLGAKYSTRAGNAAACVANYSPDSYFDFHTALFSEQPEEGTSGLSDDQLVALSKGSLISNSTLVETCIREVRFKKWLNASTARAFEGPLPNSDLERVTNTPTIIVNGVSYTGAVDDATEFAKFVSTASGNAFNDELKEQEASPSPAA